MGELISPGNQPAADRRAKEERLSFRGMKRGGGWGGDERRRARRGAGRGKARQKETTMVKNKHKERKGSNGKENEWVKKESKRATVANAKDGSHWLLFFSVSLRSVFSFSFLFFPSPRRTASSVSHRRRQSPHTTYLGIDAGRKQTASFQVLCRDQVAVLK